MEKLAVNNVIDRIREGTESETIIAEILSLAHTEQETLIGQIARVKSEKAARFLALLLEKAPDKTLQKLIRKAIFQLRTQGIALEEHDRRGESVLKKVETARESKAFLSNYDPEQTRAVVAAFELKRNQFLFSQVVAHFSRGLIELRSFPVGRQDLDSLIGGYVSNTRRPMVIAPISTPYAGYLVEEASATSGKDSDEARSLNRLLAGAKGEVRKPSDILRLPAPSDIASAPVETIIGDEVFEPFLLTWTGMEEDEKKLAEVANPSIVVPPYVIEERRQAFLTELIDTERITAALPPFKRMLEDTAYLFHSLGQFDRFKGTVEMLGEPQTVKTALRHFVRKTLDDLEKKEKAQKPDILFDPHSLPRR